MGGELIIECTSLFTGRWAYSWSPISGGVCVWGGGIRSSLRLGMKVEIVYVRFYKRSS